MEGRATFLPFMDTLPGSVMNERSWALPGVLASMFNAFTAPGRAYSGQLDPMSPEGINEGMNFAGAMLGSGTTFGNVPRGALGMNVYHGSPHKFDKFSASKIGTGEGAQAYGHGLYFAERPGVAKSYAQGLGKWEFRGKPLDEAIKELPGNMYQAAARHPGKTIEEVMKIEGPNIELRSMLENVASYKDNASMMMPNHLRQLYEKLGGHIRVNSNLYKVDLPDEMIGRMLDWDKPLSQQPESVRRSVRELLDFHQPSGSVVNANRSTGYARFDQDLTGAQARELLELKLGKGGADKAFRDVGIPGIKYLDQGSRAAGEGSRNFVVFPGMEDQLKILERK